MGGNPLLGKWIADEQTVSDDAILSGLRMAGTEEIEFTDTKMIAGGSGLEVTYEVDGDRVMVTSPFMGQMYRILGDDRVSVDTGRGIEVVYRRMD
ncbi:MAG: hypothetical protein ACR2P6_03890 [Gammaproteobacteria bacterium]